MAQDALGLHVTEDRVLIRADREDHAPTQTESGVYLATSLAAAVEGDDPADSWCVGTIVQVGPLVNHCDLRAWVLRRLRVLVQDVSCCDEIGVRGMLADIEKMPRDMPDPLQVGQWVCFSWASGQQIAVDGERYVILRASEVLAVLED